MAARDFAPTPAAAAAAAAPAAAASDVSDTLDQIDSVLLKAIRGAVWVPLVVLPRLIRRGFASSYKLIRITILLALWVGVVFGPLPLLDEVDSPVLASAIVAWTLLALGGSIAAVAPLRIVRRVSPPAPANAKPASLADAFV